jgi:hypothetical protein
MLAELDNLTPQFAGKALEAVHLNMLTTYTMYSNIFDLKNKRVYLYYMSQYGEMVELDLAEQLALGERTVSMRRFFSPKTVAAGDAAYQRFEQRFKSAQVLAVFAGLVLVGSGVYFAIRRRGKTKDEPVGTYQPSAPKPEKI